MTIRHQLHDKELALLQRLRGKAREVPPAADPHYTTGERIADQVASAVGSWPFIIIQTVILIVWMLLNVTAFIRHWDPYPFILLNLALAFQAAYSAPVIMMSQNRQSTIDRADARHDYDVNVRAELEIELLHQKLDALRDGELAQLTAALRELQSQLRTIGRLDPA